MSLESVCDLIILFGTAYFMILKMIDSFAKPTSKLKKKRVDKEKEKIKEALDEALPKYLESHNIEIKEKFLNEIKEALCEENKNDFEEIKEINKSQNEQLKYLKEMILKINNSSKDIMRQKIMTIYHANKKNKTLTIYDKEALDELYKDYKAQNGNSYIEKYYARMKKWKVIDEFELYNGEI